MMRVDPKPLESTPIVMPEGELAAGTCSRCGHDEAIPSNVLTVSDLQAPWLVTYRCGQCGHQWRTRQTLAPW